MYAPHKTPQKIETAKFVLKRILSDPLAPGEWISKPYTSSGGTTDWSKVP